MLDVYLWFKWLKVGDLLLICRFDPGTHLTDLKNYTGTLISPISGQQNKATHTQHTTLIEYLVTVMER